MPEPVNALIRELLAWISSRPRTYEEAMEAWQTTCPRHTVWEDALIDGLIQVENGSSSHRAEVILTPRGRAILDGNHSDKSTQIDPRSDL
jgi:hypothetical protein